MREYSNTPIDWRIRLLAAQRYEAVLMDYPPPLNGLIVSGVYNKQMVERPQQQFSSPEEEVAFLREQLAAKERSLLERTATIDTVDIETVGKETLREYGSFTPKKVLEKDHTLTEHEVHASVQQLETSRHKVEDIIALAQERGIHNALQVVEKTRDPYLLDEVHRTLIAQLRQGIIVQDLKERSPLWQLLHMTLFEVVLPEVVAQGREKALPELAGTMEQWLIGLQTICNDPRGLHYVLEIAVAEDSDDIVFYVAIPNDYVTLFEKQTLSLFPHASIIEQQNDYNIFAAGGFHSVSVAALKKHPIYPVRMYDDFASDPLAVILNAFSKIERTGGGAAIQIVIQPNKQRYDDIYRRIVERVQKGMKASEAIKRSTIGGEFMASLGEFVFSSNRKKNEAATPVIDQDAIQQFTKKLETHIMSATIRLVASGRSVERARQIRRELEASFEQFASPFANGLVFNELTGSRLIAAEKAFSFREANPRTALPFAIRELASIIHFPANGILSSPQFKQSRAKTEAAPTVLPSQGTLLGKNIHRNTERDIFITSDDRLRHFYIIGQTGTGKTTLMKNMISQDIANGDGVCMIDPHGTDIDDIVAAVPPERVDDIIYFDPSRQERVVGLNMLEYDSTKPEQKTFVVNELFSIFQKLYGANPESMGPMFEQYFRNATLLVMEHPESGNTLMDISRVMADAAYRKLKLQHATNPVVVQFWQEIATKAGGEASLQNIVPYIVSKFDVFTANDYVRPIIGQQKSSFNFREIMDQRKILLVNLSKGRLGDINANLIGMILVGKILMAALSRVDDPSKSFAPFYLHMDEFQNISTDSISAILSEARKYKLSLTIAHQFMAQLDSDIKDAVFGNVGSIAAFRVGSDDASALESQFSPTFTASDLLNVPNRNAYVRILADGTPTKPFSIATNPPPVGYPEEVAARIERSAVRYGRDRSVVEEEIKIRYQVSL